ncbi:MAG TPA: sporulation protein YqfD [Tissierellia bacterium]|nr:sporulation protein YqfD [Tissierellia bacterium]
MLIFKLISLIRGYVVIRLESNLEKTLNILRRKNIAVWDLEKNEKGIKFKISYEDYIKHADLINEINHNAREKGLIFKLNRMKFRKGFSLGILISIICLFLLTSLIWQVEVVGTNQVNTKKIIELLRENNITMPASLSKKDLLDIETLIYTNLDIFKFVEVYAEGSKLIIFVREKEPEITEIKSNEPSSIVSAKNAIVHKVIAKSGQPVVKEGSVVYEGQTLIMGIMQNKNTEEFIMVPSHGVVYGKTYYNFEMKEEKVRKISVATNRSKSVYYLKINGNSIKIIGDKDPYENYNYKESIINVPIVSKLSDITILKGTYYEEEIKEIEIDEKTAQNKMKVSMFDELIKKCSSDSRIVKSTINYSEDDEYYYMMAQIELIEDIGEKVRIFPITEDQSEDAKED